MQVDDDLDIPDGTFTEQEKQEEHQWHIFLNCIFPAYIQNREEALECSEFSDTIYENDLIPESITLNSVSFYFTGTYEEAYVEGVKKCKELNDSDELAHAEWEVESRDIMIAE